MKKSYKSMKTLIGLLSLGTMSMSAQLSGLYTINSGAPVSATNFTSFTSAATSLNSLGVSGAVTFDVVPNSGPYNEQPQFNQATGISATNSILVNGNGNTLTFSSSNSSQPWTLLLNGADYMTFNNLNVKGTGTYAFAIMLVTGADNNTISTSTLEVPANTTSSNHIPVVFSGANSNYYTSSNSGNNNLFSGCTIKSGYFSICHYGLTGSPYNSGNTFSNCAITDWYYYGVYSYYAKNLTVTGCTVDRPTHTSAGFAYGFYMYYNQGAMINGNKIKNFWGASPGNTNGTYAIYQYYNPLSGTGVQQNNIQNNIFSDFNNNSYVYCIYSYYQNGFIQHNTIVLNNPSNNYTGTYYSIYAYAGGTSYPLTVRNNLYYITVGGNAPVYCIYYPTSSGVTSNYNNYYINRTYTTNYVAYYNGNQATVANLQSAGSDANSISVDPQFISPASGNYMPSSYPSNDMGTPVGITLDIFGNTRSTTVPDIGAIEYLNTPCSGNPATTSIVTPTFVQCPGVAIGLNFSTPYTVTGMTFQWQSSTTSSVGPFTNVSGGNSQALTTPTLGQNTYYTAVITCTNSNQSITATAGLVQIAGTTTNTAPYYEDFEGITKLNQLPNCSWTANNIPGTCMTYTSANTQNRVSRSGTKFASFYYNPANTNVFFTNGIYLNAGVTYSASVWYTTEYYGYSNWSNLSIMINTTQTLTGATTIATSGGSAISPSYKSLSNTFTVATSGLYYIGVRGTSSGACCGYYLSWDDLAIEIPCSLNSSTVSINSSTTTVCLGQPVTLTASGGSNYTWSNGATTAAITTTPNGNTTYQVVSTSSLTPNCPASATKNVIVNPTPNVSVFTPKASVCAGGSINLTAFGASSYNWSNGGNTQMVTVSPASATTYTVIGTNQYGCVGQAVQQIAVNNLPTITAAGSNNVMCLNETVTLTATGATSYLWSSVSILLSGSSVVVSPNVSTTYTLTGTDANGCTNSTTYALTVNACTGLNSLTTANGVVVYPNPTSGAFTVEFTTDDSKTVQVTDLTGRVVLSNTASDKKVNVNISTLANGVYYVKIQSNKTVEVVKIVKQ